MAKEENIELHIYDLTVDTFQMSSEDCLLQINEVLKEKPKVIFRRNSMIIRSRQFILCSGGYLRGR